MRYCSLHNTVKLVHREAEYDIVFRHVEVGLAEQRLDGRIVRFP